MMQQEEAAAIEIEVMLPELNLAKPFIYYTQYDLKFNIEAFLLSMKLW